MASSSGTSSGSLMFQSSVSEPEENPHALINQKKRKRMMSNRESAKRSRIRKKMHLDDLTAQVVQLTKESEQIVTSMNLTAQHYLKLEAENSILKAQVSELTHRLQSVNEIITFLSSTKTNGMLHHAGESNTFLDPTDCFFPLINMAYLNQPVMATDMLLY